MCTSAFELLRVESSPRLGRVAGSALLIALLFAGLSGCAGGDNRSPTLADPDRGLSYIGSDDSEHAARKSRLEQLANNSSIATPRFYEYLVRKQDLPGFEKDAPVLRVVFEEKVFFDTALWDIRPEAQNILDVVAEAFRKERGEPTVFVAGHTDSRGSDAYNHNLSVKRAESVAAALASRGVGPTKIWSIGFGKSVPLRPNNSPSNMAANRRVEFIIASKLEAATEVVRTYKERSCSEAAADLPELCKEAGPKVTVTAVPAPTPRPSAPEIAASPATSTAPAVDQKQVTVPKPQPINITLKPPEIQNVGRPAR
jgi:outer membrane protein OmpA-like peptidoglycan-associated protein